MRFRLVTSSAVALLFIGGGLFGSSSHAQEVCGLQDVNFDTIFVYGFDAPSTGGGIGPPASTVPPPVLGVTPTIAITWPTANTALPLGKVQVTGTVTGSTNTGVAIAGTRAYVNNGMFVTPELTLDSTATALTATATEIWP